MGKKKLGVGDQIPEFKLRDQNNAWVTSHSLVSEGALVLYFYPKDDTPGCTKEACSFRDSYEEFQDRGARVVGVSTDDSASHQRFATKHDLPFTLLADENGAVEKAFGVPRNLFGLIPGRVTYIIDGQGIIRAIYESQLRTDKHVSEALAAVDAILGK